MRLSNKALRADERKRVFAQSRRLARQVWALAAADFPVTWTKWIKPFLAEVGRTAFGLNYAKEFKEGEVWCEQEAKGNAAALRASLRERVARRALYKCAEAHHHAACDEMNEGSARPAPPPDEMQWAREQAADAALLAEILATWGDALAETTVLVKQRDGYKTALDAMKEHRA